MNPSMQTALNTFGFGSELFLNGVAKLDDDASARSIADAVNPILWLAGHLLISRKHLLGLFGEERTLSFESKFTDKYDPAAEYPSMSEIKAEWVSVSDALFSKMEQASDADFTREIDWNLPNKDQTVRGAVLFFAYHEGWHLGQAAYARKAMGMDGLVPY